MPKFAARNFFGILRQSHELKIIFLGAAMTQSTSSSLFVQQMKLGSMDNFIYIIADKITKEAAILDPSWDIPAIINKVDELDFKITAILISHDHPDHTNGVEELLKSFDVPIYISAYEPMLFFPELSNIIKTKDNDIINVGSLEIKCIHTPGHTPGCQCFFIDSNLFTGDTLFVNACGRCDLPGSSPDKMYDSIQKIKELPDETIIYPGHNYAVKKWDTLANQKLTNIYMKSESKTEFLKNRMGF
jgi:hydroxyacylglutathione hydrolase